MTLAFRDPHRRHTHRAEIEAKQVRIVALDLPTSWMLAAHADDFTARMFGAIIGMLLEVLTAMARKDCDDRRRRQAQGQAKAREARIYKGRPEDKARNDGIAAMWAAGRPYSAVQAATGCSSRATSQTGVSGRLGAYKVRC